MIMDNRGEVVWFKPLNTRGVTDFRVQHYRGKPVLTWWRGQASRTSASATGGTSSTTRRTGPSRRSAPGNGLVGDVHEFLITKNNTALFTVYHRLPVDLSLRRRAEEGEDLGRDRAGGRHPDRPRPLRVAQLPAGWGRGVVRAAAEAAKAGAKAPPYDYFHINSIDVEPNGNFLVSARNTHTVYEIDRKTKKVLWRLGGKKSDFKLGTGRELRMAARCAPPAGRHDHDLRQRRRTARREVLARSSSCARTRRRSRRRSCAATTIRRSCWRRSRATRSSCRTGTSSSAGARSRTSASSTETASCSSTRTSVTASRRARTPTRIAPTASSGTGGRRTGPSSWSRDDTAYASWNGATEVVQLAGARRPGRRAASKPVQTVAKNGFETPIRLEQVGRLLRGEGTRPQRAGPRNLRCGRAAALAS